VSIVNMATAEAEQTFQDPDFVYNLDTMDFAYNGPFTAVPRRTL